MSEIKADIFVKKCSEETPEVSIKQETELIIVDELETEKIGKYLHENNVTQEDPLNLPWHSCGVCKEQFSSTDDLTLHAQNHENSELKEIDQKTDEVTKFRCTMCDKKYTAKRSLKIHLRLHTGEKPFKCNNCNSSFARNDYLRIHMRTHTGEKPFKCNNCNSFFAQNQSLRNHMRTHTGEKPFKCDSCNSSFALNCSLQKHMRTHMVSIKQEPELIIEDELETEKIGKYLNENNVTQEDRLNLIWHSCGVCNERFSSTDDLTLHAQNHENSELKEFDLKTDKVTKFQCTICNKIYATKRSLKIHLRLHTGEKPFKCDYCDSAFARNDYFRIHMRTHTGEKPYKCDICNSSFAHRGNFRNHMRTHTGEKPFKCDICNSSFARSDYLRIHMRAHTDETI